MLRGIVACVGLLALSVSPARAYDLELVGGAPTFSAGSFLWTYNVIIGGGERIQTNPPANTPTPTLPSSRSDFFIIYDFAGYIAGTATGPSADWSVTVENFTAIANRPDLQGGVPDNPNIPNLIFTKTGGGNVVGPGTVGPFSARSVFGLIAIGNSSSEFTNNGGPTDNTNNVSTIAVAVPTPEPTTAMLVLAGPLFVFGAIKRGLRRRQA
jgi:hypothetical protein